MSTYFKLSDYDVICFDLDNTLLEYNLSRLYPLQYDFLSNYMVEKKGYCRSVFPEKLTHEDADFIQRGLFLDLKRGNILYIRYDGFIIKATHGTKLLDDKTIQNIYGESRKWSALNEIVKDKLMLWDNNDTRTFLDFTDSIGVLIFAKAIDSVDLKNNVNSYNVWPDLLEAIVEMYKSDSTYIKTCTSNVLELSQPCNDSVLAWLKKLKDHSKLLLITSGEPEIVKLSIPYCLGKDYNDLFDVIICQAKKPGFFNLNRPFMTMEGEITDLTLSKETGNVFYRQGNWTALHTILERALGKSPKCVYIGDNPVQDIYVPNKISKLDTIAVIEEVAGDEFQPDYPHSLIVSSKFWGPFLTSPSGECTLMGDLLKNCAKLIIPSIRALASKKL